MHTRWPLTRRAFGIPFAFQLKTETVALATEMAEFVARMHRLIHRLVKVTKDPYEEDFNRKDGEAEEFEKGEFGSHPYRNLARNGRGTRSCSELLRE
jgi:hypothetical protein